MQLSKLLIAASLFLTACPKGGGPTAIDADTLATDPRANFTMGVQTLQTADKRTGEVDYKKALDFFVASVNLNGSTAAAFNAGWTAEILGDLDAAATYYKKAWEADKSNQPAMFSLARVYNQTGKGDLSVTIFKDFLAANPGNSEVRNDLIVALTAAGRYDEVLAEAETILLHDPKNATVYRNLSAMYYSKGELGMSQLCNEKALGIDEGDVGTYNNLGVTAQIQGDESTAIAQYKTAIKLNSKAFAPNVNLGYIALNSGDYKLALASLQAAVDADPTSTDAKLGLAVAMRGTGDYNRAEGLYNEVIAADPKNKLAYLDASILHEFYTKDFKKAESFLQAYIDHNSVGPNDPIFERKARIEKSRQEEEARKAAEVERKRLEEERRKRNEAVLAEMTTVVTKYQQGFQANAGCLDPDMVEEGQMVLEQAGMVVEMKDADMASDIKMMLEGYTPTWDEALAACAGGAAAPPADAPADPAPADGASE